MVIKKKSGKRALIWAWTLSHSHSCPHEAEANWRRPLEGRDASRQPGHHLMLLLLLILLLLLMTMDRYNASVRRQAMAQDTEVMMIELRVRQQSVQQQRTRNSMTAIMQGQEMVRMMQGEELVAGTGGGGSFAGKMVGMMQRQEVVGMMKRHEVVGLLQGQVVVGMMQGPH